MTLQQSIEDSVILIAPKEVVRLTSLSRTQIDRYRTDGRFPLPVMLGGKRMAFVKSEIIGWIEDRIANHRKSS
ncbi:helix-turn-helix transcriptional regulator [Rhizobium leguminosarum]|uniref:helix-turn-helix transcriptional regulator n=1 Tax=Rhizobium leguminosarum TaxID=384 RepID=UPI0024B3762E|nr:AlpA family phage regulatory protein [Rhizobium leguminosarum]WHO79673.1 AlpA family phage regulatory protein [Rhizobium leguminosarum]